MFKLACCLKRILCLERLGEKGEGVKDKDIKQEEREREREREREMKKLEN